MAIPVINTTTSVLEGLQWRSFNYQPFATNAPTSWSCANLPAGLTCDEETGKISGQPQVYGVFVVGLIASNLDGASAALVLTIGIEAAEAPLSSSGFTMDIDVSTRLAKLVGAEKLFGKINDDFLIFVRFRKGDEILDLDLASLTLGLKQFIPDQVLTVSTDFHKFGEGAGTYYALTGKLDGEALKAANSGYARPKSQKMETLAEIEWQENYAPAGWAEAPEVLRMTSRDFPYDIAADMVQAA